MALSLTYSIRSSLRYIFVEVQEEVSCEKLRFCVNVNLIIVCVSRDVRKALEEPYGFLRPCFGLYFFVSVPFAHPLNGHSACVDECQFDEYIETKRSKAVGFS